MRHAAVQCAKQRSCNIIEPGRRIAHEREIEVGRLVPVQPAQRVQEAARINFELLAIPGELRGRVDILHLNDIAIDGPRRGLVGGLVDQHNITDARHPPVAKR